MIRRAVAVLVNLLARPHDARIMRVGDSLVKRTWDADTERGSDE